MDRIERKKLKRKIKIQYMLAYGAVLFVILFMVGLFTPPLLQFFRALEGKGSIILFLILCLIIFLPLIFSLGWMKAGEWNTRTLYKEKDNLYNIKLRMYTEWFLQAIYEGNIKKAKYLHDNFIWGSTKALTRGILLGYFFGKNIESERDKVKDHFSRIPDEVFKRKR
jgi:hypothetical protein